MASKVRDELTPEGKKLLAAFRELEGLEVRIGFQSGENAEENGADLAEVAAFNELGTVHIPSRPFLRNSVDAHMGEIVPFVEDTLNRIVNNGMGAQDTLQRTGSFMKGLVQKEIVSGHYAPNAPATIAKKGSDVPLVDDGQLRDSVNYQIVEKGSMDD